MVQSDAVYVLAHALAGKRLYLDIVSVKTAQPLTGAYPDKAVAVLDYRPYGVGRQTVAGVYCAELILRMNGQGGQCGDQNQDCCTDSPCHKPE
jgi:hypothetical protein